MAIVQQIKTPLVSVNDTSLTVVNIPFTQGDFVKKGDVILVFETSKTTYDVAAEVDGFIFYICVEHAEYEVSEVVAYIYSNKEEVPTTGIKKNSQPTVTTKDEPTENTSFWEGETLFSHAAIQLIRDYNLSTAVFKGNDFVSKADVEIKLGAVISGVKKLPGTIKKGAISLPTDEASVIVEKLSKNKIREIEYLSSVQLPGLTSTINTIVETEGIFVHINHSLQLLKNSLLPIIIYETSRLLEKYKPLNAYFTGEAIAYYKQINIGFAIDIDKGLKVLKVNKADQKHIHEIEQDILDLSNKYLDDTLLIEDLSDISFTITDLSSEDVVFFKPLINRMNSAILGVSSIDKKLNRCILSVTFDHRVTEGKLVAQFLHHLKERLESYQSKYHAYPNQNISCFKCFKMLKDDLGDVGFTRCITPKGAEAYICQTCLKGF